MSWTNVAGAAVGVVGGALTGGADKSGLRYQKKRNAEIDKYTKEMLANSRNDMFNFWPKGQENMNMGFQSALDLYGQALPEMFNVFQQGNVGAQEQLLAGMPQYQNAVLGLPVDNSALQPRTISYDTSWMQQQLPDFHMVDDTQRQAGGPPRQTPPVSEPPPEGAHPARQFGPNWKYQKGWER